MKLYRCTGFSFASNNEHLLSAVGDTHSLDKWIDVVFTHRADKAREYFDGWTDSEIISYLKANFRITLVREGCRK